MRQQSNQTVMVKTDPNIRYNKLAEAREDGYKRKDVYIFQSDMELERYFELMQDPTITNVKVHPKFQLSTDPNISYTPDFTYLEEVMADYPIEDYWRKDTSMVYVQWSPDGKTKKIMTAEDVKGVNTKRNKHVLRAVDKYKHVWFLTVHPYYRFVMYPDLW